jgi:polycomb protein EED
MIQLITNNTSKMENLQPNRKKTPINKIRTKENEKIEDPERTPSSLEFSIVQIISEEPSTKKIYALQFCDNLPGYNNYFATAGENTVNIYRILETNSAVEIVHSYADEDEGEEFFTCAFSATETGTPLLVVAGNRGILKGIDIISMMIVAILPGHGNAVNDLKVHPVNDELMVSASYDESIRLWNIRTCVCIAIFAGEKGHIAEAICVDIHPLGNLLLSGGMDTSLKIWNLQDPKIKEAISLSYTNPRKPGNLAFPTYTAQFPLYSTNDVHRGYVDSARWVGGFILSKSTANKLCLWTPDSNRYNVRTYMYTYIYVYIYMYIYICI